MLEVRNMFCSICSFAVKLSHWPGRHWLWEITFAFSRSWALWLKKKQSTFQVYLRAKVATAFSAF